MQNAILKPGYSLGADYHGVFNIICGVVRQNVRFCADKAKLVQTVKAELARLRIIRELITR